MRNPRRHLVGFGLTLQLGLGLGFVALTGGACSSGSPPTSSSGGATGSSGGTSGGSGGASASGGTTGSGGGTASGGTTASGGATASGGTTSSGGTSASGGATASGGSTASGGATAGGGGTGTAGAAGGSPGAGGVTANGGSTGGGGRASGGGGRMGGGAGRMGGGGRDGAGAGGSTIPATMTLTSPVLMEGGMFPSNITCADAAMGSPELDWTPGPAGTMSYAVELSDLTNGYAHWVLWDIPVPSGDPAMITLKAKLATTATLTDPAGAKQIALQGTGYTGPCPSGTEHTYQFSVYAMPTATLSGNTSSSTMARATVRAAAIATGTLKGTSNARRP